MTHTRWKLNEASYFLEGMKANVPSKENFVFNLSAFLAAIWSVNGLMKEEFGTYPEFEGFYAQKKSQVGQDGRMKYLGRQRDITVHEQSLQPRSHITVNVPLEMPSPRVMLHGTSGVIYESPATVTGGPTITTDTKYYFEDIPGEDVITVCQSYLAKMTEFVGECEKRFLQQ